MPRMSLRVFQVRVSDVADNSTGSVFARGGTGPTRYRVGGISAYARSLLLVLYSTTTGGTIHVEVGTRVLSTEVVLLFYGYPGS